jgi:hypothetical protein
MILFIHNLVFDYKARQEQHLDTDTENSLF